MGSRQALPSILWVVVGVAEVRWIKITTDMFDNRKIKHLRRLPDGNNIVLIWVMLLTMAGRCNSGGMIFLTENIPYTPKMLADELGFEENTVRLALEALERLGMVVSSDGCFAIAGWSEHQNIEGMERIREQTRKRVADYRTRKKQSLLPDGRTCAYCGKAADTIDHIIPRSKNGSDDESNIVPCCKSCNSSKKGKDLADFLNDSFHYYYEGIDHDLVRSNTKLMKHVRWDSVLKRYSNVTETQSNATDIDIDKELELDKEELSKDNSKKPTKHKYGEYNNVLLTDDELDKLKSEFPDWAERIERLSSYVASTGKSYKSHYATIRNWARKDTAQGKMTGRKEVVPAWMEKKKDDAWMKQYIKPKTVQDDPALAKRASRLKETLEK